MSPNTVKDKPDRLQSLAKRLEHSANTSEKLLSGILPIEDPWRGREWILLFPVLY